MAFNDQDALNKLPQDIKNINKKLKEIYGSHLDGRPWFRIMFTDDLIEKRAGTFNEFYGQIFLREFVGIKEMQKYADPSMQHRWVLEKLIMGLKNEELWEDLKNGSYEPVWIFRAPGGEYQKPTWKSVEFLIGMLTAPKQKLTQAELDANEEAEMMKEIDFYKEVFEDVSPTVFDLHHGSGIVVPTTYSKE